MIALMILGRKVSLVVRGLSLQADKADKAGVRVLCIMLRTMDLD